jgi:uncharacterized protein (TIGR00369 family)
MRKHGRMLNSAEPTDPVGLSPSGRDVIAQFLPQSPFVAKLGIVADQLRDDEVRLRLPWDPSNVTIGDMVHGGAIATLADLTVMAAAWCGAEAPPELRGVTVSMALEFMAPARATDVIGVGRVLRRGRSLVNCEAEIVDPEGRLVAKALATYKVG